MDVSAVRIVRLGYMVVPRPRNNLERRLKDQTKVDMRVFGDRDIKDLALYSESNGECCFSDHLYIYHQLLDA